MSLRYTLPDEMGFLHPTLVTDLLREHPYKQRKAQLPNEFASEKTAVNTLAVKCPLVS